MEVIRSTTEKHDGRPDMERMDEALQEYWDWYYCLPGTYNDGDWWKDVTDSRRYDMITKISDGQRCELARKEYRK